jgi:hypothetical protein
LLGGAINDKACSFFSFEYLDISQTSMQPPVSTILQPTGDDMYLDRGGTALTRGQFDALVLGLPWQRMDGRGSITVI